MDEFIVHRVRFFEYVPSSIHCMSYDANTFKLAISRANNFIEIWNIENRWFLEKTIPPVDVESIEALCWCKGRLFSAGLHGFLKEYDLQTLDVKKMASSHNGAIWCMSKNAAEDRIAVGTEEGVVVIFKVSEDDVDYDRSFEKQEARIFALAWSDEPHVIVTGSVDNIRVWSVSSGRAIRRMSLARSSNLQMSNRDFTIISGDSRGITSFWNGHQGTLIKAFNYHKADVLTVAVNSSGNVVYSAGIDANIVKFEYLPVHSKKQPTAVEMMDCDERNDDLEPWSRWIRTTVHSQHTHDIRSLVIAKSRLFSGGVDCQLVCNEVQEKTNLKSKKKFASVPNESLVRIARKMNIIVLQYANKLDVWRLGQSDSMSDKDKELLKLTSRPVHLLSLKSSGDRHILTSAISEDATWLAYTQSNGLRVFKLHWEDLTSNKPKVVLQRVKVTCEYESLLHLQITESHLVTLTKYGNIQLISLKQEDECLMEIITLGVPKELKGCFIHQMCLSNCYIAVASLQGHCIIYSIEKRQVLCRLPKRDCPISAMVFTPSGNQLDAFYTDRKVVEFSVDTHSFTDWSRSLPPDFHPQWQCRRGVVTSAFYRGSCSTRLYLQDDYSFCYIDKTLPISDKNSPLFDNKKKFNKRNLNATKYAFHVSDRYKFLMHVSACEDGSLAVVECPPMRIIESLPPALAMKKFAT